MTEASQNPELSGANRITTAPPTEKQFAVIRARRDAIGDAPWGCRGDLDGSQTVQAGAWVTLDEGFASSGDVATVHGDTDEQRYRRGDFIAQAPYAIDLLHSEIDRLRSELEARPSRAEVLREAYVLVDAALAAEPDNGRASALYEVLLQLGALQPHTCARSQGLHSKDCPSYVPGHELLSAVNGLKAYRRERMTAAERDEAGKDTCEGESTLPTCPVCTNPPCHCSCFGKQPRRDCPHQADDAERGEGQ